MVRRRDLHGAERLHLDAGARGALDGGAALDARRRLVEREFDRHRRERHGMAQRDQLGGAFAPGSRRCARPEDVALLRGPRRDDLERLAAHADGPGRGRHADASRICRHVNHSGGAAFVEMGQFFRHNEPHGSSSIPPLRRRPSCCSPGARRRLRAGPAGSRRRLRGRALGVAGTHHRQPHHARGAHRQGLHRRSRDRRLHDRARRAPARRGEGPRRRLDFFVVSDESINAFALVGGHIGVHTASSSSRRTRSSSPAWSRTRSRTSCRSTRRA
jgi:hypothetical protein